MKIKDLVPNSRSLSVFRVCVRTCPGILQTSAVEEWLLVSTPEVRRRAAAAVSGNFEDMKMRQETLITAELCNLM